MADMTFDEITDNCDFWELYWKDFQLHPVGDGESNAKTPIDKEAEYLTSRLYPISDYPSQGYGEEAYGLCTHKSLHNSQDGILRAKKRRLLFSEQGSGHSPSNGIAFDTSDSVSSTLQELDLNFFHSMPDQTLWPLLTTSVDDCFPDKSTLADVELSKWISDILPDDQVNDKMVGVDTDPNIQTPSHLSTLTVNDDRQLTNGKFDNIMHMADTLGPKTPDSFLGRTSTTEFQQVQVSRQVPTACQENTSARAPNMCCQPFSILKPEGGLTLQSINETLRKQSPYLRPCSPMGADYGLRPSSTRDLGVSLSGKPIITRTKIITEGKGTLTIIRTAN